MTRVPVDNSTAWTVTRGGVAIAIAGATILLVYLVAMSVFARNRPRVVVGDATHHFVQLRSVVFDGDLHFQNDYMLAYGLTREEPGNEWIFSELTPTGHVRNYMPVGPAMLWAPLYLALLAVHWALFGLGLSPPPNGFEWSLQLSAGVMGILSATIGAWLSMRVAAFYTRQGPALLGTLFAWFGSHALYYSLVSPTYSHAASMLTSALFIANWLSTRDQPSLWRATVWGGLAGVCTLMRWQDALFLLVPLVEIARWRHRWAWRLTAAGCAALAWAVAFSPQMLVWNTLYGQPLALPQGPSFIQWTSPHPIAVLFSDNHGLFAWAPLLAPALIGLFVFTRRHHPLAAPLTAVLLSSWYVNAAVIDWWAGEAFGARRFLSLFPLFVLGLAVWIDDAWSVPASFRRRVAVLSLLTVASGLLLLQYQLFMRGLEVIAPYPNGAFDMWIARFVVPFRLLAWWTS